MLISKVCCKIYPERMHDFETILKRFFASGSEINPYRMFTGAHLFILAVCTFFIGVLYRRTRHNDRNYVLRIIRICSGVLWAMEIIKIVFELYAGNGGNPNKYIPLYYCSITLYCSLLSGYARGILKRVGDVFLVVGGIVGGIGYMVSPVTTSGVYPVFHFITVQSFVYHSIMIYLSILLITSGYVKLEYRDLKLYASTIVVMSIVAYNINKYLGTNLMFVSKNYPGTAIEVLYNVNPTFFSLNITLIQAVPPFWVVYSLVKFYKNRYFDDCGETYCVSESEPEEVLLK